MWEPILLTVGKITTIKSGALKQWLQALPKNKFYVNIRTSNLGTNVCVVYGVQDNHMIFEVGIICCGTLQTCDFSHMYTNHNTLKIAYKLGLFLLQFKPNQWAEILLNCCI